MKEYDIFVPLYYNDGTPVETAKQRHALAWDASPRKVKAPSAI